MCSTYLGHQLHSCAAPSLVRMRGIRAIRGGVAIVGYYPYPALVQFKMRLIQNGKVKQKVILSLKNHVVCISSLVMFFTLYKNKKLNGNTWIERWA